MKKVIFPYCLERSTNVTKEHLQKIECMDLIASIDMYEQAVAEVGMVVEGLNALPGVKALAAKYHVEMPIVNMVDAIVSGPVPVRDAVDMLMGRRKTTEFSHS